MKNHQHNVLLRRIPNAFTSDDSFQPVVFESLHEPLAR